MFAIPESELDVLGDVAGLDVVELGCGTAYFSAWLARRGARPVGVDPTPAQLATARELQAEFGLEFPLVEAVGEAVPLPDASFDLALSEYGASIWADPYLWIPEAARLLRPGGRLAVPPELDARRSSASRPSRRRASSSSGRSAGCTGSSGQTRTRSSSSSRTVTDRRSCARMASRSSG